MFHRESGKLMDALEAMFEGLPHYSRATNGNANGAEYCMKAEWYFYRGDYENALIAGHQALHRAESQKQVTNMICVLFLMLRIALMKGEFDSVLELLQKMRKEIESSKEYLLLHTVEICEGYIFSLLDQSSNIPKWLEEGDYSSGRLLFPNYAMMNIVYGRALLIKGEYHKLIGSMEDFIGTASVFPNLLGQIHTYIYVAAANRRIFRQRESIEILIKALDIAVPDELYIPFVENCDHIKPLLEELHRANKYCGFIEMIFRLYEPWQQTISNTEKEYPADNGARLSVRELEIARLAADGLTNKEIGEKLFITVNTVKTALKSIFCKLSITNRTLLKQHIDSM
jgi:LuxR family maltose regulon positive regulatory protein